MKKFKFEGQVRVYEKPEKKEKDEVGTERGANALGLSGKSFGEERASVTLFYNNAAEAAVALFAKQLREVIPDDPKKNDETVGLLVELKALLGQAEFGYVDVTPEPLKGVMVEDAVVKFPVDG